MTRSDFLIEMIIKENRGKFTPKIDFFKGTPEEAIELLSLKYSGKNGKKGFMVKFGEAWDEGAAEVERLLSK